MGHSERDHALLSASSAHRWINCPPSAVAAERYPAQDTEFTREGTLAHEVAEVAALASLWAGLDPQDLEWGTGVTREMVDCAAGYAEYIQEQTREENAPVMLEQRVDFSPWVPDGFGTCDCIILQGDTMVVIDYKYGLGVAVSAENNPQTRLYALGALNDYDVAFGIKNVEMHIYQPRLNNVSVEKMPLPDLLAWADSIKPIAQKAAKGKGDYNAGAHCKFCPHAGSCRTLTKTCTDYVETHSLRVAVPVLAPHEVAEVLAMEPLVTLWLKRVKAQALTSLLDGGEVPGFKVVEGKQGNRKWTDELQVSQMLQAEGYKLEEITETKLLSPAGMDKALGKKKVAELLTDLIGRSPGAPTIVPETDKRPALDRLAEAQKDFN